MDINLNPSVVSSVPSVNSGHDQYQTAFIAALQQFEKAMAAYHNSPNDSNYATLVNAAANLGKAMDTLGKQTDPNDKAMATYFLNASDSDGYRQMFHVIDDCTNGDSNGARDAINTLFHGDGIEPAGQFFWQASDGLTVFQNWLNNN